MAAYGMDYAPYGGYTPYGDYGGFGGYTVNFLIEIEKSDLIIMHELL
jgi:hypothetical protein